MTAQEQRVRMHAAIARAHLAFYRSLADADRQNMALVQALPTTSSGVLDTSVAQDRINRAQQQIGQLGTNMEQALSSASYLNWLADQEDNDDYVPISLWAIRSRYQSLISSQQCVVNLNEQIIQRANEYDAASRSLYASVSVDTLQCALNNASSYLSGGGWGSTAWVERLNFEGSLRSSSSTQQTVLERFLAGDLATIGAVATGSVSGSTQVVGIPLSASAIGSLLGGSASLEPYGTGNQKLAGDKSSLGVGVKGSAEAYAGKASLSGTFGRAKASLDVAALTGSAEGKLGGSLFTDGQFAPSFAAKGEAKGSVLEETKSLELDGGIISQRVKAKGSALTASAEAGVSAGLDGIEGKVGAEAYVVKGEVTSGISVLGVRFDMAVEGKAGGAGANVGAKLEPTALEGALGLGLGLGLSAKVKVDWSEAINGLARNDWSLAAWWDELLKKGEAA